ELSRRRQLALGQPAGRLLERMVGEEQPERLLLPLEPLGLWQWRSERQRGRQALLLTAVRADHVEQTGLALAGRPLELLAGGDARLEPGQHSLARTKVVHRPALDQALDGALVEPTFGRQVHPSTEG